MTQSVRQAHLLPRWLELTRRVLPCMAACNGWPISADHCFMRVCLDISLGTAWPSAVRSPAYRSLSDAQFAAAIAIAESIVAKPAKLPLLNARSLDMRKAWRAAGSPKAD